MLDETIITETPPLYSCYGHIGQQVRVPITGHRAKRVLHGVKCAPEVGPTRGHPYGTATGSA
jgi:hypothetical protein